METTITNQRKLVSRTRRQRWRRGLVVDEYRRQEQEEEEEQAPAPVTPPSRRSTAPRRAGDVKPLSYAEADARHVRAQVDSLRTRHEEVRGLPLSHQEAIAQRINVQIESLNTWHEGVRGPLRSSPPQRAPPTPPSVLDRALIAEEMQSTRQLLDRMREESRSQSQSLNYGLPVSVTLSAAEEEANQTLIRMREQGLQQEQQYQQQRGYGSQPPAFPVSRAMEDHVLTQGRDLIAEARRQAAEAWTRGTAARLNTTDVSMAGVNAAARAAVDARASASLNAQGEEHAESIFSRLRAQSANPTNEAMERGLQAESAILSGTIAVTPEELARDFRFLGFVQENNQRQAATPCNDPEDDIEDVDDSMLPRPPASEAPRRFGQGFFEFPVRLSEFVPVPILNHSDGETDSDDDDVPEPEDQEEEREAVSTVTMTGRYLTSDREMYEVAQESDWDGLCAQDYVYRGRVDDQQEQPVHAVVPINERFLRAVNARAAEICASNREEEREQNRESQALIDAFLSGSESLAELARQRDLELDQAGREPWDPNNGGDTDSAMSNLLIAPHVAFRRYAMPAPAEEAEADNRPGVTVDRERIAAAVRRMADQQSVADRLYGQPPLPEAEANARAAVAVYNRPLRPATAATAREVTRVEFERILDENARLGVIPRAESELAAARRRLREQQEPRMNLLYGMRGSGSGTTVYPETDLCSVLASTTSSNNIWAQADRAREAGPAPVPATPQLLSLK